MNTVRIIPCLDVDHGRVVKGVQFRDIRDAGDPVELAALYHRDGADEIAFLDIGATPNSRRTLIDVVEQVSQAIFTPLTAGGGVSSVEQIRDLLNAGADKVTICSAALKNPSLLSDGSRRFGSQCIVLSIDAKKTGNSWNAFTNGGRTDSGADVLWWAQEAERLGVGEILLNSIDRDGLQTGYDLELIRKVSLSVSIPVIASGGAGEPEHLVQAIREGNADAVLLASILHDKKITIPEIKKYLIQQGVNIRWSSQVSI